MIDVLGIGAAAVDDLVYVDHFPAPDTKLKVQGMQRQGGGLAATALVAVARLGLAAAYGAYFGGDDLSRYTIAELETAGVDCSRIVFDADARPYHSVIIVDMAANSRTILYTADGVRHVCPEDIGPDWIGDCRVLLFDHHVAQAALAVLPAARRAGIPVVIDVEDERAPGAAELLAQADHVIVGLPVAGRASGETDPAWMARALAEAGQACVTVTAGPAGCWYTGKVTGGRVHHVPAFTVPVVDTTGCGDVFHGVYAAALALGQLPQQAVRMAAAAAALKATRPGGRAGIPDLWTLQRFLAEHSDEDTLIPT
jgi:sulfofructose kinase